MLSQLSHTALAIIHPASVCVCFLHLRQAAVRGMDASSVASRRQATVTGRVGAGTAISGPHLSDAVARAFAHVLGGGSCSRPSAHRVRETSFG